MTTNGPSIEVHRPQEPLSVLTVDEIGPVPILSPDSQSFVVIKSAAELDELLDDNEISDISLLQDHKQILQEELAQFDSHLKQSSSKTDPIQATSETISTDEALKTNQESSGPSTEFHSSSDINQNVLPALPNPQAYQGVDTDDPDQRTISIVSFAPSDFGSEEIQARVTHLIEENLHLKDTILQNNMSMKTQYDRIVAWQKEVEQVNDRHKEKFRDAKKCIDTLKQENAVLKAESDNLRQLLQVQLTEHDKTKRLLTETSENNLKEFELDVANNKIKELEAALEKLTLKSRQDLVSETAKYKAMEEKLLRYEKELENAYKQVRGKEHLEMDLEKSKAIEEKLHLSEMAYERTNKELLSLRNQLARNVQTLDDTSKIQLSLNQAIAERNMFAADLESRNATIMDVNSRCLKLEENLQEANKNLQQYEETAKFLKEKEELAKIDAWVAKQRLTEAEKKNTELQNSFDASQQARHHYSPGFNPGELAYIRQQLMQSQKALIESDQNRAVAEGTVGALKNENSELRKQIDAKESDEAELFALREQLNVYKADFEAEREAKEEVKRDKNKIAEDLQHLNRRNQQLQEEIEICRNRLEQYGDSISHPIPHTSRNQTSATNGSPELNRYVCPICGLKFRSLKLVQDHADMCLGHAPW